MKQGTIPTNHGDLKPDEIMDVLMWGSYKSNRDKGCSHEQLIKFGIGNEAMKQKYESTHVKSTQP